MGVVWLYERVSVAVRVLSASVGSVMGCGCIVGCGFECEFCSQWVGVGVGVGVDVDVVHFWHVCSMLMVIRWCLMVTRRINRCILPVVNRSSLHTHVQLLANKNNAGAPFVLNANGSGGGVHRTNSMLSVCGQ